MNLKFLAKHIRWLYPVSYRIRNIRPVRSMEEFDRRLPTADAGRDPSKEELDALLKIYYKPSDVRLDRVRDPFSQAYAENQWKLYRHVAGKAYDIRNEATPIDEATIRENFFPYSTGSSDYVGDMLVRQGFLIKSMHLKPGTKVVEFGAGWGNTAVPLAMMHYRVTAVEAHGASADLIRHRAGRVGREMEVVSGDMLEFARTTREKFDAVIFSASFHHCWDHLEMIRALAGMLAPGGSVFFADEPIHYALNSSLPYPWGIRLDGNSLYYVRKYGWLELGFQYSYLKAALGRSGFATRIVRSPFRVVPDIVVATLRA